MPKVKWAEPKPNYLHELIRSTMKVRGITSQMLGDYFGITDVAVRKQINKSADLWTGKQLKAYCKVLDIPIDQAVVLLVK